jgi:hypothetical protein
VALARTAVGLTLGEYTNFLTKQIEDDCNCLVELSRLIHKTPQDQLPTCVGEYCSKNGKNLIDKYATIIFHMNLHGFNPDKFKQTMQHFGMNLSKPFADLMLMYFRLALPHDRDYNKKLEGVKKHIELWETQMNKIRNQEELVKEESQAAVRNRYASYVR